MSNHLAYMRFLHGSPHLIPSGQVSFRSPGDIDVYAPYSVKGRPGLITLTGWNVWLPTRPREDGERRKIVRLDYLGNGEFSITPYIDGLRVALDGEIKPLDVNAPFTLQAGNNHHSPILHFHGPDAVKFTQMDVLRDPSVSGFAKNRLQENGALYD